MDPVSFRHESKEVWIKARDGLFDQNLLRFKHIIPDRFFVLAQKRDPSRQLWITDKQNLRLKSDEKTERGGH